MNYNHRGSLAERFIQFRSSILAEQDSSSELFHTFSVYIPSNIASEVIEDVVLDTIEDEPVVIKVNVDNYLDVMKGGLLAQWGRVFNNGTNFDLEIVLVVFYVPDGSGTDVFADYLAVDAHTIDYAPLTQAFEELWFASFFKTMYSPKYDGVSVTGGYDDQNYFDMALALAQLCKNNPEMSMNLAFVRQELPLEDVDTNVCKLLSKTRAEEREAATSLDVVISGVDNPRRDYFWGMLDYMQAGNTWLITHSEDLNMFPVVFAKWFEARNETRTYIGNKTEKIRLSGSDIKPTGTPSLLNSEANTNLPSDLASILEDKNVGYFISIADGTLNDSILVRSHTINGTPATAIMIPKWVDYYTSQAVAKMIASSGTLTKPVLKNESTYKRIQEMLLANLQKFAQIGRLTDIKLNMPAYTELPESKTDIVVTQGWQATYVYDLEKVTVTGFVVA